MNTPIILNNSTTIKQTTLPLLSSGSSLHTGSHLTPVYLNLYDLGGCNNSLIHSIGLSFYHCAVQTHSAEYGYMGHPYEFTGLYKTSAHDSRFHLYKIRQSIEISWTWFNEKEIDQIVNDLQSFYMGFDYHTTKKNSIHFAKYLLEQLSNDSQLKHLESIQILQFPSYVDRCRRLTDTFQFLQIFDREKDIAEINILYFLYMKYQGNIKEICQILKCQTIDQLKRFIELIEQGIQQKKLPIFSLLNQFNLNRFSDYLYDKNFNNDQLTLTDIFRQFDTITLRGRTSIDRYLNIQKDNSNKEQNILSHNPRSLQPQSISQNQVQTPITSPSASNISGLSIPSTNPLTYPILINSSLKFEHLNMKTAIPIGTLLRLQDTSNPNIPLRKLYLTKNTDENTYSLLNTRQRKHFSSSLSSRKRKLPRDFELTNDLYKINNLNNSFNSNYTNHEIYQYYSSTNNILSFQNIQINEDTDSTV